MNIRHLTLLAAAVGLAFSTGSANAGPRDNSTSHAAAHARPPHAAANRPARDFHRDVTAKQENGTRTVDVHGTTGDGRNWDRHVETTRTENGYTRTVEGTTPDGKSYSRNASVVRDREAGTVTRTVDGTLPDGRTWSTDATRQRTENGYTGERVHVAPDGTTVTDKVVATRDADGTIHRDVTHAVTPPQNDGEPSE